MTYFLAPALVKLRDQVNAKFPNRDKTSDGWIGDASHAARPSDHNPCWNCPGRSKGIVRAIDIDITPDGNPNEDLRVQVIKAAVGDPRVWYVISNGIIYSRTHGFKPLRYTGSNPHTGHVHVSLNGANGVNPEGNFNTDSWFPEPKPEPVGEARLENFRESRPDWDVKILDRLAPKRSDVRRQVALIDALVKRLPDDEKDTRVKDFKDAFENRRLLKMSLLNEAVSEGRMGTVRAVRDRLRTVIKKINRL